MPRAYSNGVGSKVRRKAREAGYRSGFEEALGAQLAASGVEHTYEPEQIHYYISAAYTPDWKITTPSGTTFYIEAKGFFTDADRQKLLRVKQNHPGIDIRLIFQSSPYRPLRRGAKMTWAQWCEKNGFPYGVGSIPEEWLR